MKNSDWSLRCWVPKDVGFKIDGCELKKVLSVHGNGKHSPILWELAVGGPGTAEMM